MRTVMICMNGKEITGDLTDADYDRLNKSNSFVSKEYAEMVLSFMTNVRMEDQKTGIQVKWIEV